MTWTNTKRTNAGRDDSATPSNPPKRKRLRAPRSGSSTQSRVLSTEHARAARADATVLEAQADGTWAVPADEPPARADATASASATGDAADAHVRAALQDLLDARAREAAETSAALAALAAAVAVRCSFCKRGQAVVEVETFGVVTRVCRGCAGRAAARAGLGLLQLFL